MTAPRGAQRAQRFLEFLAEARRRKVYVSAAVYIAAALGAIQLAQAITDAGLLPDAAPRIVTIAMMVGFPVVIVLAWIFDITTRGLVRTDAKPRVRRRRSEPVVVPEPVPLPEVRSAVLRERTPSSTADSAATEPDRQRLERAALGHMRHELRTPVNAITGYAEMLLEDANDADIEADLRRIRTAGRELLAHIDRLLNPDSGQVDGDAEAIAARVHSELRTPATTVIGYAELLLETCRERGRDEMLPDLERIVTAARRTLETSAGVLQTGSAPESLVAETQAMTREVLGRIRPVEPGSMGYDGDGRILVVDDNAMNRDLLLRQLARSGYTVDSAGDGLAALELIAERDYDVILLDVLMPKLDGVETLRRIRAQPRLADVPVLMLSSLDEVDSAIRCLEIGAEEYLSKPFQPTLLAARIAANISLRRLRARDRAMEQQLQSMRESVQRLARAAFPGEAATRMLRGESGIVHASAHATVVACTLARPARPHTLPELVQRLNELAQAAASVAERNDVDVLLIRPHGVLLAVGLTTPVATHARAAVDLTMQLLQRVPGAAAGLHSAAAAGGIVGGARPHYDVWGEAVETAEALAAGAAAGTAVLSPGAHAAVRDLYAFSAGPVGEVAGHGHMRSWLLRVSELGVTA